MNEYKDLIVIGLFFSPALIGLIISAYYTIVCPRQPWEHYMDD